MKGLLYKDFQLILNKFSYMQRVFLLLVAILMILFLKEAGTFGNTIVNIIFWH